jgi:phosphoserine phosphatase
LSSSQVPDQTSRFVESVLALHLDIAVFDCDGTLWSGDAGRDFFYWEIERGIVSPQVADAMTKRYRLYEVGEVGEESMCGEMVTMHHGLPTDELYKAGEQFFVEVVSPRIFPEMQELTHRLADQGCELWAVSSTNNWVVEADELKDLAIREVIGKPVDGVFGNSLHDQAMLEIAKHPFCINPNPDLEQAAREKNWPIYWPKGMR